MSERDADEAGDGATGPSRCPACGARVVESQEWCSLCHAPLRSGAAVAPPDVPSGAGPGTTTDPLGQPVADLGPVGAPVGVPAPEGTAAAGDPVDGAPADPALAEARAEAMLAELAVTSASERPGARGPLAGLPRPARLGLGCGAALLLVGVLVGVLALVGMLL
jgi:hypothetical protein